MDIERFNKITQIVESAWANTPSIKAPQVKYGSYLNNILFVADDTSSILTLVNMEKQIMMIPKYKCPVVIYNGTKIYNCTNEPNIAYCSALNDKENFVSENMIPLVSGV